MEEEIVELFSAEDDRATGTSHVDPWDVVYNVSVCWNGYIKVSSLFYLSHVMRQECRVVCNSKAAGNKIHSLKPFHVLCRC